MPGIGADDDTLGNSRASCQLAVLEEQATGRIDGLLQPTWAQRTPVQ
jgi:hypothetical protein